MVPGPSQSSQFATSLLRWFDRHRRDLPWRRTTDPWAIWVSEVMLQQTRVEVVRDSYERFLARYPRPADWARVDDAELHQAWRGLGYYRRARMLRDAAQSVVDEHDGQVPADPDVLGRLPGVGRYTRGAIASIAFGHPELAIDGNVERVVSRYRAIEADIKLAPSQRQVRETVAEWIARDRAGDFNQALMELGATICTPGAPRCEDCPVSQGCRGRQLGVARELPRRRPPRTPVEVGARFGWVEQPGGVLAYEIPTGEVNAGQLELPGAGLLQPIENAGALAKVIAQRFGAQVEVGPSLASFRHSITHHRITVAVHRARLREGRGSLVVGSPDNASAPWSTASRKAFRQLRRPAAGSSEAS